LVEDGVDAEATVYKLRLADRCVMLQSRLSQVCNDFMLAIHVLSIHICETESKVTKVRGYKLASIFSLEFVYICCARLLNLGQEGH